MRDKCVILVTHQMQLLMKSSKIMCLKEGRCLASGTFDQLLNSGIDFMSILKEQSESQCTDAKEFDLKTDGNEKKKHLYKIDTNCHLIQGFGVDDENENTGDIDRKVYFNYFKSNSGWLLILLTLLSTLLTQTLFHLTDYWLTLWYVF